MHLVQQDLSKYERMTAFPAPADRLHQRLLRRSRFRRRERDADGRVQVG